MIFILFSLINNYYLYFIIKKKMKYLSLSLSLSLSFGLTLTWWIYYNTHTKNKNKNKEQNKLRSINYHFLRECNFSCKYCFHVDKGL